MILLISKRQLTWHQLICFAVCYFPRVMFVDEKSDDAQVLSAGINIQLESETVAKTLGNVQLAAVMGFTKIQIPKAFQVGIFNRITRHCFEYCFVQCHFGGMAFLNLKLH